MVYTVHTFSYQRMRRVQLSISKVDGFCLYLQMMKPIIENYLSTECKKPVKLSDREIEVLGNLMYHNNILRDIKNNKTRGDALFDFNTKNKIRENIKGGISDTNYRNTIYSLRKKKALIKRNINTHIVMFADTDLRLSALFKFNDKSNG